jgi:hypothetical protein
MSTAKGALQRAGEVTASNCALMAFSYAVTLKPVTPEPHVAETRYRGRGIVAGDEVVEQANVATTRSSSALQR